MASDSLTYLSTVAPKVILGTATADDYRAAVEECMNGMNLDVITVPDTCNWVRFNGQLILHYNVYGQERNGSCPFHYIGDMIPCRPGIGHR